MKNILSAAMVIAIMSLATFAQVPDQLKEKFRKENPDAMGMVWKADKENTYRVNYTVKKEELATIYDKDGNVVSTQTLLKENIPAGITEYYQKHTTGTNEYAPSYTVWQTTDKNGNISYYSEYDGKQAWFDKDGKQISRSGVAEGDSEKQDDRSPIEK